MKVEKDDIYKMISDVLSIEIERIGEDVDLLIHGMNSISAIQLVVALEEKYKFEFKDDDLLVTKFNTFNKLFDLLKSY